MKSIYIVLLISSFYGLYDFAVRLSAGKINPALGAFLCQTVSAVIALCFMFLQSKIVKNNSIKTTREGIIITMLAGFLIGFALFSLMFFFQKEKANASTTMPTILALRNIIVVFLAIIILKEKATPLKILGLSLSTLGLYFILN